MLSILVEGLAFERSYKLISYAQNLEDVVLARAFDDRKEGFYIDLGAGDPHFHSVTKHFYDAGWSGINVEPLADKYQLLCQHRPRDTNLHCAVDDTEGTKNLFSLSLAELSSLDEYALELAKRHGFEVHLQPVSVIPLRTICERHVDRPIQFLKIDVEGWEQRAISSGDWKSFRPEIIVVEATKPFSVEPNYEGWESHLINNGYLFAYFDGLNRFYVATEREILRVKLTGPPDFQLRGVRLAREVNLEVRVRELESDRERLTAERDVFHQEMFESNRIAAHLAFERQKLLDVVAHHHSRIGKFVSRLGRCFTAPVRLIQSWISNKNV